MKKQAPSSPLLRGLVLAAGTGNRLRPLTNDRPKALLELRGTTLLERMARQCAAVGMSELLIVTGHAAQAVEDALGTFDAGIPIRTIYNPEYEAMNNAHSLWCARQSVSGGDFVVFDGDMLLHTDILRRLVELNGGSAVMVDRTARLADEEMKARVDASGALNGLGKWLDPEESVGEAIGLNKIAARDAGKLFAAIEQVVHSEGQGNAYYEDVCHRLIEDGWRPKEVDTAGLPWTEIDTIEDLQHAERLAEECDSLPGRPLAAASACTALLGPA